MFGFKRGLSGSTVTAAIAGTIALAYPGALGADGPRRTSGKESNTMKIRSRLETKR
jgi:hypothetical protein